MYEVVLITIHIIIRLCSRMVRSSHIARAMLGPAPLYHNPTLTTDVRRYKYEITVTRSVVITLRRMNRRYFIL
jgi:hypothetical protein